MQPGDVLGGKYRIDRLIGDGGMGTVYEAEHLTLGARVAIKVLHPDLARRPGLGDRFLQEARVAAQIRSPFVVHVTDVDRTPDGISYLVMELLEGDPLSAVLSREHRLPVATACDYTLQVLRALEAAHALGVIHRDLKPENVFVTQTAHSGGAPIVKLIDFGIAKLKTPQTQNKSMTAAGVLMGTAEYMAPEQVHAANEVDGRADLYAVGVMLYEMIAGTRPVAGENALVIALKVERGEVTPLVHAAPGTPPEIAGLVHRAMAASPALRFASATDMRSALENARSHSPSARPPTRPLSHQMGAVSPDLASTTPHLGSGTEMGTPLPDAIRAAMNGPAKQATQQAPQYTPPTGQMYGAPPAGQNAQEPYRAHAATHMTNNEPQGSFQQMSGPMQSPGPSRRAKKGFPWWIAILAVLLGGGVVATVLIVNYYSDDDTPQPVATATPVTPASPATTTPGAATAPQTSAPLAPLSTSTVHPPGPVAPGPGPKPHPTASASGSAAPSANPVVPTPDNPFPPVTIPTGFPSSFPLPPGLPTGLPTGLPNLFPLPGTTPTAQPTAQPTATSTTPH